jgi:hypothetical protein
VSAARALAGIAATLPHTAALAVGSSLGSRPLPPAEVIGRAVGRAVPAAAWLAAHFAAGGFLGVASGAVRAERSRARGVAYGLAVWAVSYGAVLPSLRLYPAPSEDEPARAAANVVGHALFGLTVSSLGRRFSA